jgi:hypothetical protein
MDKGRELTRPLFIYLTKPFFNDFLPRQVGEIDCRPVSGNHLFFSSASPGSIISSVKSYDPSPLLNKSLAVRRPVNASGGFIQTTALIDDQT